MAASIALTTAAAVKSYLGITGSTFDTVLGEVIAAVSQSIERYCKRKFKQEEVTEYHDGAGYHKLAVDRPPFSRGGTISIWVDLSIPRDYADGDLLTDSGYTINHKSGIITRPGGFPAGDESVKITYTGGLGATTGDLPDDLQLAAKIWVASFFVKGKEGADGIATFRLGAYSATYDHKSMPSEVRQLLATYRYRRF